MVSEWYFLRTREVLVDHKFVLSIKVEMSDDENNMAATSSPSSVGPLPYPVNIPLPPNLAMSGHMASNWKRFIR